MKINVYPIGAMLLTFISVCLLAILFSISTTVVYCNKESATVSSDYTDTMHLASIINAECGLCDESEQRKTGSVILNRVYSAEFPSDILSVISQKGQFNGYCSDNYYPEEKALSVATDLMNCVGLVDEILYFWNPKTATDSNFLNKMQGRILYKEKYHYYAH